MMLPFGLQPDTLRSSPAISSLYAMQTLDVELTLNIM